VLVLRGDGLGANIPDTDPQVVGGPPRTAVAAELTSERTARFANAFIDAARGLLGSRDRANMVLLRGFSTEPEWPEFGRSYNLNPAAIAAYPMYRGLARLAGMKIIPTGADFDAELKTLADSYSDHDYFFLHYKPADGAGEDGDFDAKVARLEELDARIPAVIDMNSDVLVVAGDHSTPAIMEAHSWHPVPLMINSRLSRGQGSDAFDERVCRLGALGAIPATNLMLLALAHAGKLAKFGA